MSSLDRLQELLDERDIKYERKSFWNRTSIEYITWWGVNGFEFNAITSGDDLNMLYIYKAIMLPEDIVDATVGRKTCRMELLPDEPMTSIQPMHCTTCGHKTYVQLANYCPHCGAEVIK